MTLSIRPLTLREANAYVVLHHRHNKPVVGHRYSIVEVMMWVTKEKPEDET